MIDVRCDSILVRSAVDDFWALLVADAMQSNRGVEVVSIVYKQPQNDGGVGWHIFAKFAKSIISIDEIDAAIDAVYERNER